MSPSRHRRRPANAAECSYGNGYPQRDGFGAPSGLSCDSSPATRVSIAQTRSGGSDENTVGTLILYAPGGRLRFVNDAPRQTEFGVICIPEPVSIWVRAN